jgi:Caenorhabditis protein of unknown function, DUF268
MAKNLGINIGRTATHPLRQFFNERFHTVETRLVQLQERVEDARKEIQRAHQQVDGRGEQLKDLIAAESRLAGDTAQLFGTSFLELRQALATVLEEVERTDGPTIRQASRGTIADINSVIAELLNYASGYKGFAAQAGLWFNPAVWPVHLPGDVRLGDVNERIAEIPYVFRALARAEPGSTVLDVGGSESTMCLSLASLGYKVTTVDPRPAPLAHPGLRQVPLPVEEWETDERFDVIVLLSTIEHIGVGAYGQEENPVGDMAVMHRLRELIREDGLLILTTPYGAAAMDEIQRTYDDSRLNDLLTGWVVNDFTVLRKGAEFAWTLHEGETDTAEPGTQVVMITARPSP